MKMLNLAAIDPTIQQKGMSNFSKLDEEVWKDFFEGRLTFEAEPETIPGLAASSFASGTDYEGASIVGHDVIVTAKARRGQAYFRGMILSSYRGCCALSGVNTADLLVASHIVPWAENKSLRMNPTNGICLNVFLDKAFDRGLMTFDHDFRVVLSDRMSMETKAYFQSFLGTQLKMPDRFLPSQDNLEIHRTRVFR